jgi:hypothetical protein
VKFLNPDTVDIVAELPEPPAVLLAVDKEDVQGLLALVYAKRLSLPKDAVKAAAFYDQLDRALSDANIYQVKRTFRMELEEG